jgi:hypothetical protein
LADLILRALKYSIAPLYDATFVLKERNPSFTQPRTRFSATGTLAVPIRKYQLSLIAPTPPSTASVDFVFFFPDWIQRIPLCTSFDDMVNVIEPLMSFIGLHVSRDALFVTKMMRLGRSQLLSTVSCSFARLTSLRSINHRFHWIQFPENHQANLTQVIPFDSSGSSFFGCTFFLRSLSFEAMQFAPSIFGTSFDNMRLLQDGDYTENGNLATYPILNFASDKCKLTVKAKAFCDAFRIIQSRRYLERWRN